MDVNDSPRRRMEICWYPGNKIRQAQKLCMFHPSDDPECEKNMLSNKDPEWCVHCKSSSSSHLQHAN
ncbi:hypothetical protein ABKN59_007457 [Abortiporus biennis]